MLERHRFPISRPTAIPPPSAKSAAQGRQVYYGDASNPAFLKRLRLHGASAVIVTIHTQAAIDEIVRAVRAAAARM